MKKNALIALAVVVVISLCANIYQFTKLNRYADRYEAGLMKYYEDWVPAYPVDGLSIADLSTICAAIDMNESDPQNRRILNVDMMDNKHVVIQTGIMKGGLWGGGRIFQFRKDENGWVIEPDKTSHWIS